MTNSSADEDYFFLKFMLCSNAVIGWLLLEWAWFRMRRFRKPNKDLDAIYPAYRRDDALQWRKWKLYPGALTILVPRLFIATCCMFSLYFWLFLIMIGHDKAVPITGCRKIILTFIYKLHTHMACLFSIFHVLSYKNVGAEEVGHYEEYLGSLYQQEAC